MHRLKGYTHFVEIVLFILSSLFLFSFSSAVQADVVLSRPQVNLSWNPSPDSDVQGYELYRATFPDGAFAKISSGVIRATSYTDTAVLDGNSYSYRLTAVDTCGNTGPFSLTSEAAIIQLTNGSDDVIFTQPQVKLSWNPSPDSDVQGYELYRATSSNGTFAKISSGVIRATSYTDTTVLDGNSYYYRVTSVDTCGNTSPFSLASGAAIIKLTDDNGDTDTYVNQPQVKVSWNPSPDTDTSGYEVYRATAVAGNYAKTSGSLIETNTWIDTDVADGNRYYYRVAALDVCGNRSSLSAPSGAVVIDTISPVITVSPLPGLYSGPITVTLQANETSTIYYTTNGTTPTQTSAVYTAPISLAQTTVLTYFALDRASNESTAQTAQYTIGSASDDSDGDGYTDTLETQMGTDPTDPNSQPVAASLKITQPAVPVGIDSTLQLSVVGTFTPVASDPIEVDLSSLAQYQYDSALLTISNQGLVTGQKEGIADIQAVQATNGVVTATSNTVHVTIDGTSPSVDLVNSRPYNGQGTDQDSGPTPRIPYDTGVVIRVFDAPVGENIGIDEGSIRLLINQEEVPAKVHEIVSGDLHELDLAFQNTGTFDFGQTVTVELNLTDMAGNPLAFSETFQVESQTDHQWAAENSPPQSAIALGDGTTEVSALPQPDSINDDMLEGAKIVFSSVEPVQPRFGPVDEVPALDLTNPVGIPLNLEPVTEFDAPVTVFVPVPGAQVQDTDGNGVPDTGLESYDLYLFSPRSDVLWRNNVEVTDWMVEGSRKDHYETMPPSIEVQINQPVAIQVGTDLPPVGTGDPVPDVKVNGQDEIMFFSRTSSISVSISLSGGNINQPVDWWILANTPRGWYSYNLSSHSWVRGIVPGAQQIPAAFPEQEISTGRATFGRGSYVYFFAVDDNADGRLDATWYDAVGVLVW